MSCHHADSPEESNGKLPQPSVNQAEQNRRVALYMPAFEQLVLIMRGRVRYPSDYDQWHRDERSDFKRHRMAIGDTLLDAACEPLQTLFTHRPATDSRRSPEMMKHGSPPCTHCLTHSLCAAAVLGAQRILQQLVEPLQRESQASGTNFDWRNAEAALYCIRCIAQHPLPWLFIDFCMKCMSAPDWLPMRTQPTPTVCCRN